MNRKKVVFMEFYECSEINDLNDNDNFSKRRTNYFIKLHNYFKYVIVYFSESEIKKIITYLKNEEFSKFNTMFKNYLNANDWNTFIDLVKNNEDNTVLVVKLGNYPNYPINEIFFFEND